MHSPNPFHAINVSFDLKASFLLPITKQFSLLPGRALPSLFAVITSPRWLHGQRAVRELLIPLPCPSPPHPSLLRPSPPTPMAPMQGTRPQLSKKTMGCSQLYRTAPRAAPVRPSVHAVSAPGCWSQVCSNGQGFPRPGRADPRAPSPCEFSVAHEKRRKQISLLLCNGLLPFPRLGHLASPRVETHAAAAGEGAPGAPGLSRLAQTGGSVSAPGTSAHRLPCCGQGASLHHDVLSWNGAGCTDSLHDGCREEKIKRKKKKRKGKKKIKETAPWSQIVRFHSSCQGVPFRSRCRQRRVWGPGPRGSHPAARATSPARCGRLPAGSLCRGRGGGLGAGAEGGARGARPGRGGGGRPGGGKKRGKGKRGGKKKIPGGEKSGGRAGRGDVMRAAAPGKATPLQPTGGAPLSAPGPTRLRGQPRAQRRVLDDSGRAGRPEGGGGARGLGCAAGTLPRPLPGRDRWDAAQPPRPLQHETGDAGAACWGNFWG